MNHVRIHGDPFGDGAGALRALLQQLQGAGMCVSLSLVAGPDRSPGIGERRVTLDVRGRRWDVVTRLPERQVDRIRSAMQRDVVATAPVVVFAGSGDGDDDVIMGGVAWPKACAVIAAGSDSDPASLTARVRAELRWSGNERQRHALPEMQLRPWLALEPAASTCVVHVTDDAFACGTDLVVECFARDPDARGLRLRLITTPSARPSIEALLEDAGVAGGRIDVVDEPFAPRHVHDAAAIVQPYRRFVGADPLVKSLASGRPVVCARFAATAHVLAGSALSLCVGGRKIRGAAAQTTGFAPDLSSLRAALSAALREPLASPSGDQARAHVVAELLKGRPVPSPPPVRALGDGRPKVVLEAPIFDASAAADAAIATARTMIERGHVDLHIVPTGALRRGIAWLRARAPELVPRIRRNPGRADLWLSSGWPLRADRPDCRRWALQVGAEVDATRVSFGPHLTEEADHVLVQSHEARRALCAAGREAGSVSVAARAIAASLEALIVCEDADVAALPRQSVVAAAHPKTAILATSARQRREPARA